MLSSDSIPFRLASSVPGRLRIQYVRRDDRQAVLRCAAASLEAARCLTTVDVVHDAASLVVRYNSRSCAVTDVLRQVEAALAGLSAGASGDIRCKLPSLPAISASGVSVLHAIPGRVRLRLSRAHVADAATVAEQVAAADGIHAARSGGDFLIVHYDPKVHHPAGIVRLVVRLARMAARSPRTDVTRGRDLLAEPPKALNPLALPSIALGLALAAAPPAIAVTALTLAGLPIAARAWEGARERKLNVDQLDLASLLVLASLRDFRVAALMTWLIGLGDYIRQRTMRRSRRAISELMSPAAQTAWIEREGELVSTPVEHLQPGDVVVVNPGDQVPVDGVLLEGRGLVDQKLLTGESSPVAVEPGDPVYALTGLVDGRAKVRVEQIGSATRASRVVAMIEDAPLSDTRIQDYAARFGDRLVGPTFALAGASWLLTRDPARMASILILDFATGIRLSAPTTILAAMMGAARQGLFVKGGRAMEKLADMDAVVFDKTGTLTRGEPVVTAVHLLDGLAPAELLGLAASAESSLRHPAARAVVAAAEAQGYAPVAASDVQYVPGLGIHAEVEGRQVAVGSERFIEETSRLDGSARALARQEEKAGRSTIYVAVDGRLAGMIAWSDPPRPESALVIQALRDRRVRRLVMLTGDRPAAAAEVAGALGIDEFVAEAFPEQKAEIVQRLQEEGHTVGVVGDGINDSPAFAVADVGISLQHGADVAKETADVILLDGDLRALPRAIDLSRDALRILHQNANLIVAPTLAGMAASVAGISNPLVSTLINNGTAVLAGLNALRPLLAPSSPNPVSQEQERGSGGSSPPLFLGEGPGAGAREVVR